MTTRPVGTYLRFLRKQNGLSQRRLAEILGSVSESQVSRHERSSGLPTILAALAYQAVFRRPVSEIFPGLYHTVEIGIEERLNELAEKLGSSGVDDPIKEFIAGRASRPVNWQFSDYGYRRLHVLLQRRGHEVNVKRVYRLYLEERLMAAQKPRGSRFTRRCPRS